MICKEGFKLGDPVRVPSRNLQGTIVSMVDRELDNKVTHVEVEVEHPVNPEDAHEMRGGKSWHWVHVWEVEHV